MIKETEVKTINGAETGAKFPSSVDFMLLGQCNLACDFCFGPEHKIPPMRADLVVDIIDKLSKSGVESVVFTGGEPTLDKDLWVILMEAKRRNLTTVLSTNGIKLVEDYTLFKRIASRLDWIALPLEADNPKTNEEMRTGPVRTREKQFDVPFILIPRIRKMYPDLKVKLGTVVARRNIGSILGIPDLLASLNALPDTWKLYQISPSEYGKLNYSDLQVSDEMFELFYGEAEKRAKAVGIPNIQKYTNRERPGKYLFINPRGDALTVHPDTNDYFRIGNFLTGFDEVAKNWRDFVNSQTLTANFETTYPSS